MNKKPKSPRVWAFANAALLLTLLAAQTRVEAAQPSKGGSATNSKVSGKSAAFQLDDGERFASLTVTRDAIANTTSLSFGYRFADPGDPNRSILTLGDGEIPNSAFSITSNSARLTVTTPASYPVTRCVVNNETGEASCSPAAPSTFDLAWVGDGSFSFHQIGNRVETTGQFLARVGVRFDEASASVSGTWDGHSAQNLTGFLTDSENATLLREIRMPANARFPNAANPLFLTLSAAHARVPAPPVPMTKVRLRDAFGYLTDAGLNGFVSVVIDEVANTTTLSFSYAFPDPSNPAATLLYQGEGAIPESAFITTAASGHLAVTTPSSFPILRCVIVGVIGEFTCATSTAPVTFDLAWIKDGVGSVRETTTTTETSGSVTTKGHRQFNQSTAVMSGTWRDMNVHSGARVTGLLESVGSSEIAVGAR